MYVPRHFAVEDLEEIRGLVRDVHVGQLVTVGADGAPDASLLPVLWEGDEVVVHLARANEHWRRIVDGSPGLVVVTGPDAYITPALVRVEARARAGGADLELLGGPPLGSGDGARRPGMAAAGGHPADRPPRGADGRRRAVARRRRTGAVRRRPAEGHRRASRWW